MSDNSELRNDFNINFIKTTINSINQLIEKMTKNGTTEPFDFELEIMTQYPEFYNEYPFLVKKLCKKEDTSMLYKMFENLEQVQSGDKSLASVELKLGNELADKYINSVVKKT